MRCRHHWDQRCAWVNPIPFEKSSKTWKARAESCGTQIAGVKEHIRILTLREVFNNATAHDVARCEFAKCVPTFHEAPTCTIDEMCTLTAHRFRNE